MTIIVLGGGITSNEKLPLQVKDRLDEGVKLFRTKNYDCFLVCGRYSFLFEDNETPNTTEAKLMKKYLLNKGISEDFIFLEEKSMDTMSNAYFAKTEYFIPKKKKSATVVTSDYHLKRVEYVFNKFFGPDYSLAFLGVKTKNNDIMTKRQKELLLETKELTKDMHDGDHKFFDNKFFSINYYKKTRSAWIKKITKEGKYD